MKNRLLILLSIISFSLLGCHNQKPAETETSEPETTETETESETETEIVTETVYPGETVYDERDYQYENKLNKPSQLIHNMEGLKKITDYHAFYKDVDSFDVTIASDYEYKTSKKTVESEINYLYWYGELVNGVMGISGEAKDESTWTISYTYYDNAYINAYPTATMIEDLFYVEPTSDRSSSYNNFATEDDSKAVLDVATSQQLWYAAEHGYRINALPNTPAEKYYNLAKDLLRNIIKDDMTDYQKVSTIYDYIEHHSSYCFKALEAPDSEDPKNFPDKYCSGYKAFFIEGFFDNGTVVCDGFSKVYTLLGKMEGLNIVRGSGTSDNRWTTKEVAGHAYCFVSLGDYYYLSCPTWGQQRISTTEFILNKNYFLSPKAYMDSYPCNNWTELVYSKMINNINYFKDLKMSVGDKEISAYITDEEPATYFNLLNQSEGKAFIDVYFSSTDVRSKFLSAKPSNLYQMQISEREYVFLRY